MSTSYAARLKNPNDSAEVASLTTTNTSEFQKGTTWDGPPALVEYPCHGFLCNGDWIVYRLIESQANSAHVVSLLLMINYQDANWRNYDTVAFVGGDTAPLHRVAQNVSNCDVDDGTCMYSESASLALPDKFLTENASTGFKIQVSAGGAAPLVVEIPGGYITGFGNAVAASAHQTSDHQTSDQKPNGN